MSERVKFREGDTVVFCGTTDDPRDNGSRIVITKVRGRKTWTKLDEPEYKAELPSGVRVVRESELAPVPTSLEPNDQAQGGTLATETAPQTSPIPAAASVAIHTVQVVKIPAPAAAKPVDTAWPPPPLQITTYDYPGARRPG